MGFLERKVRFLLAEKLQVTKKNELELRRGSSALMTKMCSRLQQSGVSLGSLGLWASKAVGHMLGKW